MANVQCSRALVCSVCWPWSGRAGSRGRAPSARAQEKGVHEQEHERTWGRKRRPLKRNRRGGTREEQEKQKGKDHPRTDVGALFTRIVSPRVRHLRPQRNAGFTYCHPASFGMPLTRTATLWELHFRCWNQSSLGAPPLISPTLHTERAPFRVPRTAPLGGTYFGGLLGGS